MIFKGKRLWVYTGDRPSNSAKELAAQPGFLRLRPDRFHKVKPMDVIINWGVSTKFDLPSIVNKPEAIGLATNKLLAFDRLAEQKSPTPYFTDCPKQALEWCLEGATVVVRNKLTGHSGDGIVILEKGTVTNLHDMMNYKAPLYTKYIFKQKEFRVHVVGNAKLNQYGVIDTQQKIRDPDQEVKTWKVRSHQNGFIFARNNVEEDNYRNMIAIHACAALGLDFGAVDLVQDKKGLYYVLEVNTAPGLEGQSVPNYATALKELYLNA